MKFTIEQITDSRAEEVLVKCCDSQAVLTNGETVIVSRKYVSELKRLLGM